MGLDWDLDKQSAVRFTRQTASKIEKMFFHILYHSAVLFVVVVDITFAESSVTAIQLAIRSVCTDTTSCQRFLSCGESCV